MPRFYTVAQGYPVLKTWRGHNKEWNIFSRADRRQYLHYLRDTLDQSKIKLHGAALMANHAHEQYDILDGQEFSRFMRNHHARYGMYFNRTHQRCGKVAQDRPHTQQIENDSKAMLKLFYVLCNPLRHRVVKDLRNYEYCSYNYYAFGKPGPFAGLLTYPPWYLALGPTPSVRQRKFRQLFVEYLQYYGLMKDPHSQRPYFGDLLWEQKRLEAYRRSNRRRKLSRPPP